MSDITPLFALDAEELMLAGNLDDAIDLCKRGLEVYPDYAMGHYIIANSRFLAGEVDDAKGIVASALEIFPENITLLKLKETLDNHKEEVVAPEEVEEEVELAEEEPELGLEEWTSIDKNDYSMGDAEEQTEPEETIESEKPEEVINETDADDSSEDTTKEKDAPEEKEEEPKVEEPIEPEEENLADGTVEEIHSEDEEDFAEDEIQATENVAEEETDEHSSDAIDDESNDEDDQEEEELEENSDETEDSKGTQMGDPREIEELMTEHNESEVQLFFGRIPLSSINPPDLAVILRALKGKDLKRRNKILNTDLFFDVLPKLDSVYEEEAESSDDLGVDLDIDPDELDVDLDPDDLQAALDLMDFDSTDKIEDGQSTEETILEEYESDEVDIIEDDPVEEIEEETPSEEEKTENLVFSLTEEIPDDEFSQLADSIDNTKMEIENGYEEVETPEEESFEDEVVSDTMAEILTEQGEYKKAIEMYKTLLAENPEKQRDYLDKIAELEMLDMF